jgi:23S rRNA (cytidine1920-2'-O)/16S rRNA (cytidine1409-2'-O)-methyltransferase
MPKKRLDALLVDLGLAETRSKARALIMAGRALVDGSAVHKPGVMIDESLPISIKGKSHPYVSRGGIKLAAALDHFHIDPAGMICLDIGASTGGFTDCLLQRGAAKVWAVDVGTNQLDYRLRTDPRVISLENTNARELDPAVIADRINLITADVSFISLKAAIPPALPLLAPGGMALLLVKPQFEAARENVGEGGVVRDAAVREAALNDVEEFFQGKGLTSRGTVPSPITGPKGNVEYFLLMINVGAICESPNL